MEKRCGVVAVSFRRRARAIASTSPPVGRMISDRRTRVSPPDPAPAPMARSISAALIWVAEANLARTTPRQMSPASTKSRRVSGATPPLASSSRNFSIGRLARAANSVMPPLTSSGETATSSRLAASRRSASSIRLCRARAEMSPGWRKIDIISTRWRTSYWLITRPFTVAAGAKPSSCAVAGRATSRASTRDRSMRVRKAIVSASFPVRYLRHVREGPPSDPPPKPRSSTDRPKSVDGLTLVEEV